MNALKRIKDFIVDLFGFKKNPKYVRNYFHEANIRSSIYMAAIIIVLEIWMIIRQFVKHVRKFLSYDSVKYKAFHEAGFTKSQFFDYYYNKWGYSGHFEYVFNSISFYLLFIIAAVAVLVYAISFIKKNAYTKTKKYDIASIIVSVLCILWIFMLIPQKIPTDNIGKWTTILMYIAIFVLGVAIFISTMYSSFIRKAKNLLSVIVITSFAALCLIFGLKIGYSDFAHTADNLDKYYMITCFLTMVIFVTCLLIWKPYISILMNITIFIIFDYMLESFDGREFLEGDRVNYITFLVSLTMIAISIYQQRIREANKDMNLEYIANYDELTSINNFHNFCKEILKHQKLDHNSIVGHIYLFLNIENFKTYNDKRTFEFGDGLLKSIGLAIKEEFKDGITARQGDDHFVVFTKNEDLEKHINNISEKLRMYDNELKLILKVGSYIPELNEKPNRAVDKARYACGMCKNRFDKNYAIYDYKMDSNYHKRQYIINNLDNAIKNGWIVPYYQPVVFSDTKKLCGVEALVRWIDPTYGFIYPSEFIPVLEDYRLIHKLDSCLWERVCKDLNESLANNKPIVPVSLNFSRLDFELMDAFSVIDGLIKKYNIDKNFIHVEITESALNDNVKQLNDTINQLRAEGYAVWLDDFGSGYSSLNVLKDYTFDVVKIDMKFLSNFEGNQKAKDILNSVIDLSNKLGMKTLTEGVETSEQAEFLKEIGCLRLQGYLFGKPMPKEELYKTIFDGKLIISEVLEK